MMKHQPGGLTLLLNFLTAADIIAEFNLEATKIYCKVSRQSESIGIAASGSGLKFKDTLTLYDLFHGLKQGYNFSNAAYHRSRLSFMHS